MDFYKIRNLSREDTPYSDISIKYHVYYAPVILLLYWYDSAYIISFIFY